MDAFRPPVLPLEPCFKGHIEENPHGTSAQRKPGTLLCFHLSLAQVEITWRCFCTTGHAPVVELSSGLVEMEIWKGGRISVLKDTYFFL